MSEIDSAPVRFRARPSWAGILSGTVLVAGLLALGLVIQNSPDLHWLARVVIYGFSLVALFFQVIYFTIRYEFVGDKLRLKCGPFRWCIPIKGISEVTRTDLKYHPTSTGWKLPGYALFTVYYADRGNVIMCATRACNRILLIATNDRQYGITPEDEDGLINCLRSRMK